MYQRKVYIYYIISDILELNIPTSVPLVYQFDENLKAKSHAYLGD